MIELPARDIMKIVDRILAEMPEDPTPAQDPNRPAPIIQAMMDSHQRSMDACRESARRADESAKAFWDTLTNKRTRTVDLGNGRKIDDRDFYALIQPTLVNFHPSNWRDLSLSYQYAVLSQSVRVVPSTAHPVDQPGGIAGVDGQGLCAGGS